MKKNVAAILAVAIMMSLSVNTFAASPNVIVETKARGIPQEVIDQIIQSNPAANEITIYDYQEFDDEIPNSNDKSLSDMAEEASSQPSTRNVAPKPYIKYDKPKTTLNITARRVSAKRVFQFSVAKGETVTLTRSFSASYKGSISGSVFNKADIGAEVTMKGSMDKTTTYVGPPEDSPYNSREFGIEFFEERGTYVQTRDVYRISQLGQKTYLRTDKVNGTYKKPVAFASYSVNNKI